jgi:hypothetical protein
LLQHRTKDLEGLSGQLKGFSLEEAGAPVAWAIGDDAIPDASGGSGQTSARLNLQYRAVMFLLQDIAPVRGRS